MRDYSRQQDLIPMDVLHNTKCIVIGVGAVGRNVAVQLASMGAREMMLIDHDMVDESNITTQGYRSSQVGMPKVEACRESILEIDPTIKVEVIFDRWRSVYRFRGAVFCCVDSMEAREAIFKGVRETCTFWCDGRMQGFNLYCYPANEPNGFSSYAETLFPDSEAEPGRCTARSTLFAASFLASAMLYQFVRSLRGESLLSVGGMPCMFAPL